MPALALVDALPDFSRRAAASIAPESSELPQVFREAEPRPTEADIEARVAFAVERAEAALAETLGREHEARLAELAGSHEAELAALRDQLGAGMARTVADRMAEAEARMTGLATQAAARILAAFVSEDVQKRAVEELAGAIRKATGDAEAVRLRVCGPSPLHDRLVEALGKDRRMQIEFVEAATADLVVGLDETQFETRIAEWSEALDALLS